MINTGVLNEHNSKAILRENYKPSPMGTRSLQHHTAMEYPSLKCVQSHSNHCYFKLGKSNKDCSFADKCVFHMWLLILQVDCICNQLKASLLNIKETGILNEITWSRKPILNLGPPSGPSQHIGRKFCSLHTNFILSVKTIYPVITFLCGY